MPLRGTFSSERLKKKRKKEKRKDKRFHEVPFPGQLQRSSTSLVSFSATRGLNLPFDSHRCLRHYCSRHRRLCPLLSSLSRRKWRNGIAKASAWKTARLPCVIDCSFPIADSDRSCKACLFYFVYTLPKYNIVQQFAVQCLKNLT